MKEVITILKVIPSGVDVNRSTLIEVIKEEIGPKNNIKILKTEEKPLVFGLYSIELTFKIPDDETGVKFLDNFQKDLEDLEEIDTVSIELQALSPD